MKMPRSVAKAVAHAILCAEEIDGMIVFSVDEKKLGARRGRAIRL